MSWPRTSSLLGQLALVMVLLLPVGCGFTPVHGRHGAGAQAPVEQLALVAIDVIPDRHGQILRNHLIDHLYRDGRPAQPRYRLATRLTATREDLGIRTDATATRARLRLVADYQLIDIASGTVLYRTFSRSIVSFNLLEAQYTTLVAEEDAYARALDELGQDMRARLALYFQRSPSTNENSGQ